MINSMDYKIREDLFLKPIGFNSCTGEKLPNINTLNNIIIIRDDGIGDHLMGLPITRELKRSNPNCNITFLSHRKSILESCSFIDRIIEIDSEKYNDDYTNYFESKILPTLDTYDLAIKPKWDFDKLACYTLSKINSKYKIGYENSLYVDDKIINGFSDYNINNISDVFTHYIKKDWRFCYGNDVCENLYLIHNIDGCNVVSFEMFYSFLEDQKEIDQLTEDNLLETDKYIIFGIGGNIPDRRWGIDKFSKLGEYIFEKYNFKIVIVGGNDVKDDSEYLCKRIPNSLNLCSKFCFSDTMKILSKCFIGVTNNTSLFHGLNCFQKPILEFSPTPIFWDQYRPGISTRFSYGYSRNVVLSPMRLTDDSSVRSCENISFEEAKSGFDFLYSMVSNDEKNNFTKFW